MASIDSLHHSTDRGNSSYRQLEEQLSMSTAEALELRTSLTSHEEKVGLLEHKVSELEERLSEECNRRDARVAELNTELESKSNAIAYLTQQLRQAKLKLKAALEENGRLTHAQIASTTALPVRRLDTTAPRACRTFRRTTSSPLPQDTANFEARLNSGNSRAMSPPTLPPPLVPRPPSTGSPSHPLLHRRASSKVRRRWSHSPKSSGSSSTTGLHSPHPPPNVSPCASNTSLGPISMYRPPTTPPDVSDILRHNHDLRAKDSQLVVKRSPPVLPPIQSETSVLYQHRGGEPSVVDSRSGVLMPSHSANHVHHPELSHPQHSYRHRHLILAQAQGLSSAPSALRVLRYSSLSRGRLEGGRGEVGVEEEEEGEEVWEEESEEEEEEGEEEMVEGRLLVRETVSRKDQAWQELHQHGAD